MLPLVTWAHPVLFVSDVFFLSEDSLGEGIVIFVL